MAVGREGEWEDVGEYIQGPERLGRPALDAGYRPARLGYSI
jgi:hypothetical protein